jgi:hypothetical protein
LSTAVPSGLDEGNVPAGSALPTCQVKIEQGKEPVYFAAGSQPGAKYIDYRKVTFTIRAVGTIAMGSIAEAIKTAFNCRTFTVPNAEFMACILRKESMDPEQRQKQGNDVRKAVQEYELVTERTR